jgi:ankyrin repeat protein
MPVDNTAHTALSWAATLARVPLLKIFIAKGASIFRVNRGGETALMKACVVTNNLDMGTFPDILELLGPTIELRDARGRTVLHHIAVTSAVKGRSQASKYYLESLLEFVVRQGSAPNSQQSFTNGLPALKSMGIGRFMSEIVNVQDKSGDTALNIAARIGNRSIISQLLEVGADPSISNRSNLCPIDFGIGDPADAQSRAATGFRDADKTLSKETRESSGEIINCKFCYSICHTSLTN